MQSPPGPLPNAPPPTYESLINGEKQQQQDPYPIASSAEDEDPEAQTREVTFASQPVDIDGDSDSGIFRSCCSGLSTICAFTVGVLLCLSLGLALPIVEIYFGSTYLRECPAQRFLPIYLVVSGSVMFLAGGGSGSKAKSKDDDTNWCTVASLILIFLFLFCWLICGSVWVFRMEQCHMLQETMSRHCFTTNPITIPLYEIEGTTSYQLPYCHLTVYQLTYWIIVVKWIIVGLAVLICGAVCCASGIRSCFKNEEDEEERGQEDPASSGAVALTSISAIDS